MTVRFWKTNDGTMTRKPVRRKLIIIGDVAVGKTSFLWSYFRGQAPGYFLMPIIDARVEDITFGDVQVELALWDTASFEEYDRLRPLNYLETHVVLIAFAIDSPESLLNASTKWYEEARSFCGPDVPVLLVGCKSDLRSQASNSWTSCLVSREDAEVVATLIGARGYYECSAFRVEGLSRVIEEAVRASMGHMDERSESRCILC